MPRGVYSFDCAQTGLSGGKILHGACPEQYKILLLHFVQGQDDRRRRAQNDKREGLAMTAVELANDLKLLEEYKFDKNLI